jgi:hypothetical protein
MNALNPDLQDLGFRPLDRVVVVHADVVGMCQATLPAIEELTAVGLVTSGAAMVPCAWFLIDECFEIACEQGIPAFLTPFHGNSVTELDHVRNLGIQLISHQPFGDSMRRQLGK